MERKHVREGVWREAGDEPPGADHSTKAILRRSGNQLWRLFFIQSSRNEITMDGLGFFAIIEPLIRTWTRAGEDAREVARRHLGYFNAGLYLSSAVAGVVAHLETKRARGEEIAPERIERVKSALSSVLAARANYFFEGLLIPLGLTIACIFAIYGSYLGCAIFLALYNFYHFRSRIGGYCRGLVLGEGMGGAFVARLFREERVIGACAAFISGAFAALLFAKARSAGGTGFLAWGAVLVAGSALLRRRVSLMGSIFLLAAATVLYLALYPYVVARVR